MSQSCQIVHVDSDSDRGTPVQQSRCCRKCRLRSGNLCRRSHLVLRTVIL